MTVLDLDGPIGFARVKRVEEGEVVRNGFTPDFGMELLRLGHEHPACLLQGH